MRRGGAHTLTRTITRAAGLLVLVAGGALVVYLVVEIALAAAGR